MSTTAIMEAKTSFKPPIPALQSHPHPHHAVSGPAPSAPPRVPTLDLKAKLAAALGANGKQYWSALVNFCTAKISRDEFEKDARSCLKPEDVHLHNALVLGILYNASSSVPGPSTARGIHTPAAINGTHPSAQEKTQAEEEGEQDSQYREEAELLASVPPQKRIRLLTASLSNKERQRIKALGKAPNRSLATGANASSWAGAGADLLEKRRKEEEKKQREAETRRLRQMHTHIGATDWTKEILTEEATRQENRSKLPVATLQALLRSIKVPLCSESRRLPDADVLADLMTSQAVEAGLNGGVASEASGLLLSGLQAHLQNVASSLITAIRANCPVGGITMQPSTYDVGEASGDASRPSFDGDSDRADVISSPVEGGVLDQISAARRQSGQQYDGSVIRVERPRSSDVSSRTSTSSNSASTSNSSIFTTGSRQRQNLHAGAGPDASVISLASTAPTTQDGANSGANSDDGMDIDPDDTLRRKQDKADASMRSDSDLDREDQGSRAQSAEPDDRGVDVDRTLSTYRPKLEPLPFRTRVPRLRPAKSQAQVKQTRRLALRDIAFLLDLTPHVVVEPVGLGAMERLMAPDFDEDSDHDDDTFHDCTSEQAPAEEERLALAARLAAYTKDDDVVNLQNRIRDRRLDSLPSLDAQGTGRQRYVVNQQGPLALILQQQNLSSLESTDGQTAAGQEPDGRSAENSASVLGKRSRPPTSVDPITEVVDPVSLLAGLCN